MVTYRNQLEVAPLKNIFFLDVLKLEVKDCSGYNKEIERMGKTFHKRLWEKLIIYKHYLACILLI